MFSLDGKTYASLEEASKGSNISLDTLKKHIDTTWSSRKGVRHSLTEIVEEVSIEVPKTTYKAIVAVSPLGDVSSYDTYRDAYTSIIGKPDIHVYYCCSSGNHLVTDGPLKGWSFYYKEDYNE